MSDTPTNSAVYQLISELSDDPESDSIVNKEEQEDPLSPREPAKDIEQRSMLDVSARLSDYGQRKRTTIMPSQKAVLEEFYASGMTSSGIQFSALHRAAAQKTGLSVQNVQHWIRNRRRPLRKEKGAVDTTTLVISLPSANDSITTNSPMYLTNNSTDYTTNQYQLGSPELTGSQISSQLTATSPVSETTSTAILVKCRIGDSVEKDFVEVEVPTLTYMSLLQSCCEELEVEPTAVAKIRKLPNTLVRKNKDVMRLNTLQELELVLHM